MLVESHVAVAPSLVIYEISRRFIFITFFIRVLETAIMQLFVKGLQTSVLEVNENDTVLSVKGHLSNSDGIPCEEQVLMYAGRPLDDEDTLVSYGIGAMSTLSVEVRMLGGTVVNRCARVQLGLTHQTFYVE